MSDPNKLIRSGKQLSFASSAWFGRRMVFVAGPHGSGKTSIVKEALDPTRNAIFDLGPIVRTIYEEEAGDTSFAKWVRWKEKTYGPLCITRLLGAKIKPELCEYPPDTRCVIIGNRSVTGIEYFKRVFKPSETEIIYLDAPPGMLFDRYRVREKQDSLSYAQFKELLNDDEMMGLQAIRGMADHIIFNNNSLEKASSMLKAAIRS